MPIHVHRFTASELANVYSFLTPGSTKHDDSLFKSLAAYSIGNTAAFSERYGKNVDPATIAELKSAAPAVADRTAALGALRLMTDNGPGDEDIHYIRAIADIMDRAFKRVLEVDDAIAALLPRGNG